MSRLFISHSSKDGAAAKAFKQWLGANGWPDEDVFLDVDNIDAGERWKEALKQANLRCEAVILLASPDALASPECIAEIRKAEDYGKEVIVVLLRDLEITDDRLDAYKEHQIVDLAATPMTHIEAVSYRGADVEVKFNSVALERVRSYLVRRGIAPDYFAWPPPGQPDADPFPGFSPFTEQDAGIFFGRDADILRGLDKLRIMRRNARPRALIIQAASGAGKSSYLRAGLWPRLERDPDFAPLAVVRPASGILTGPNGLGHKLAAQLAQLDEPVNPGDIHKQLTAEEQAEAARAFKGFMATIAARALAARRVGDEAARTPALVLAVDQAEELFAPEDEDESRRFMALLAGFLADPPPGAELIVIFTTRSDRSVRLLEELETQGLDPPEILPLLPLPATSFRDIVLKPLDVLEKRGQRLIFAPALVEQLIAESVGADALPLLAFTLSCLYRNFSAKGTIGPEQYDDIGGVAGCIKVVLKRALANPRSAPTIPAGEAAQEACLRAAFIPWLARMNPETGAPMRRVERLQAFSGDEQAMVERLVEARLLLLDRRDGIDIVEIAHESLLRQWRQLAEWLTADADKLKLVESVDWATKEWARQGRQGDELLEHRASRLRAAERLLGREDFRKRLGDDGLAYLAACRAAEGKRARRVGVGVAAALVLIAFAWVNQATLQSWAYWLTTVQGRVLSASAERTLAPLAPFQECVDCPPMVVVGPDTFTMGGLPGGENESDREYPPQVVTIAASFAVAATPVTFTQFGACIEHGGCNPSVTSPEKGEWPAVELSWHDAQAYAAWLARLTGKPYRLLSEAEYEYALRAGTKTYYPWPDRATARAQSNCGGCRSAEDGRAAMPVGSFPANAFGLFDMNGNVFQWVADCAHDDYKKRPPIHAAVWDEEQCRSRVIRGASWNSKLELLRSSSRDWHPPDYRSDVVGFRVARSLGQ